MKLAIYFDISVEDYKANGNLNDVENEINELIKIKFKEPRKLNLYGWEKINDENAVCRCSVTIPRS